MTQVPTRHGKINERQIAWKEWSLWSLAVAVTLILTVGIVALTFGQARAGQQTLYWFESKECVRGLCGVVLLFNIYTFHQHLQLRHIRRRLNERDQLFQLITENAADMIAVVDSSGQRIYNSPSYERGMGYTPEELANTSALKQVHPADQERVLIAAETARTTGEGERLEYRMRHKNGSWRLLESTASPVRNPGGHVEKLVIVNRDITERRQIEEMLAHNALHDSLTNLPNRELFIDRLGRALIRSQRHAEYKFAVLFVDIDDFRVVNDSLGHSAGDELLVQFAARLCGGIRDMDTFARCGGNGTFHEKSDTLGVARFAGDEFTVLLEDVGRPSDAVRVAQRIQSKLAAPFVTGGRPISLGISVGAVLSSTSYMQAEEMLRDAELAMYRAKAAGKGKCEVFDIKMHSNALRRLTLETELRQAVERHELEVYYQPIVSLDTGKIVGFEALSRWMRPCRNISPTEFIPVADETGLILRINSEVYSTACSQLRVWQEKFKDGPPLTISLNVAPRQFMQETLVSDIDSLLKEVGLPPATVYFEIMETAAMGEGGRALTLLHDLKSLGVGLSIDDFGTGYSSLSRLPKFPVDILKIDRAFITDMCGNRDNYEIVRLVITLAHGLGLRVVAEGVDQDEHIYHLRSLGCQMAQGYFFAPPVTAEDATRLLTNPISQLDRTAIGGRI